MHIVHPDVEKYIDSLWSQDDLILAEMEGIADEKDFPIIGPEVGRLLYMLAKSSGAKRVLELGSGYGYSAYWFAHGVGKDGKVTCTDLHEFNKEQAMKFLKRAKLKDRIEFHVGSALEILQTLEGPFDIVFNDIDKEDYAAAIDLVEPKLKPGGLFITDNALWYGKVAEEGEHGKTTQGVLEFNSKLMADERFETVILPIRDGVALAMKR